MSNDSKKEYLNIEISNGIKDQVSSIKITPELKIQIKVKEELVIESIHFKNLNKKSIADWQKTFEAVVDKLKSLKLDDRIIIIIHANLSQNIEILDKYVLSIHSAGDQNESKDNKNKFEIRLFKYYSNTEERLYESITFSGLPYFISYDDGDLIITNKVEEINRVILPCILENSSVKSYDFIDENHLRDVLDQAKVIDVGYLYDKVKEIVTKFIDQKPHILSIITVDIIFSYFQDRFPTTHYLFFTGDNAVGKSVIGDLFELLGYRAVKMTSPSVANIYRLLGKVEAGQCVIIVDEADQIDNDRNMMNILKTGYTIGGIVPKINLVSYEQEFFNSYCLKIFLAERLPSAYKAKGLLDRTFPITCLLGVPQLSLKDVLVSQGKFGNHDLKQLQNEILALRRLLLAYRLINAFQKRPNIDTGLKNRDKELCVCLTLFYGSKVQKEIENAFQILLDARYEQQEGSFDTQLIYLILECLKHSDSPKEIFVMDLWNCIKNTLPCEVIKENEELFLTDYGFSLHRNQLSKQCYKFGGVSRHTNRGNKIVFQDTEKLKQLLHRYSNNKPVIHCTSEEDHISEGYESSEGNK